MASVKFTIYDPNTGEIMRSGVCAEELVERFNKPGGAILRGHRADPLRHKIDHRGGAPLILDRPPAEVAARRAAQVGPPAPGLEELLSVLNKRHGIKVTLADLRAEKELKRNTPVT